ncbi:CHC2 zinc finger domain-containing protein, partial [Candidatus Dependentiae bacterium]
MNLFSYVKSRLSILDIIGQYTKLRKAGTYWKANCPFHHEKTASFTVSPHKEIFYCFGCHTSGDLISFIAKVENCSQLEAAQHLIETYQIEVPEELLQSRPQNQDEKNNYFSLCEAVANWCHSMLKKSPSTLRYLRKRNINDE